MTPAPPVPALPAPFGRFTLVSVLGAGGMGTVYRAVLTGPSGFRKDVALKVLRGGPDGGGSLTDEARIGGLLKHPHVVDVYDFGELDGRPFIVLELIHGLDLAALVKRTRLHAAHVLEIGVAIAAGLAHAHDLAVDGVPARLVHRDLKPSNVLVSRDGVVKVMDFGIATASFARGDTETGAAKGTPAYMAPEQASAEAIDHRADLWSLGVLLHEIATGARLLAGQNVLQVMMQLLQLPERLARPGALQPVDAVVPGLGAVVARCLRRDPAERWPTAAALEDALRALSASAAPAPSLRALVRDVLGGGDGRELPALLARTQLAPLALSATRPRATPTNLQADPGTFVGRDDDLRAVAERLERARLVTLLGPGGTGKTRLAREHGLRTLASWPGGAWFVPLEAARTKEGVLHAVGLALDLPVAEGDPAAALETVGRALAGRGRALFVLDNVEQIVQPSAEAVARWLALAPDACFLVTSRERLRVAGEDVLPVGPLDEEAAVALFADRAAAARPGWTQGDDAEVVRSIVRRLDRLPLAVELAAARVAVLPPARLHERLDQRFRLLRGGGRDVTARQATLQGAIAWSWELLDGAERHTLAGLSLFPAGFSVEQAEAMLDLSAHAGAPLVLDVVEALRDKSLLRALPPERGEPRFGMYESIRAFAMERLDELGSRAELEAAHARVTLSLGQRAERRLQGPEGADAQLDLAVLVEDLVAVARRADPQEPGVAVRAIACAEPHLRRRGPAALYRELLDRAVVLSSRVPPHLRVEVFAMRSQQLRLDGRNAEALALAWEALALARSTGDAVLAARACIPLGYSLRSPEGLREVEAAQREALAVLVAAGEEADVGRLLSSLAIAVGYGGRVKEEHRLHREALAIHERIGNHRMRAAECGNIAVLHALDGELEEAEQWLLQSLAGFRAVHDRLAETISLGNLGSLYIELQRPVEGERAMGRALEAIAELGLGSFEPVMTTNLGLLRLNQGELAGAEELFARAEGLYAERSPNLYHLAMLDAYRGIGRALAGDGAAAHAFLDRSAARYADARMRRDEGQLLALAAAGRAGQGDEAGALAALEAARAIADEIDDDDVRAQIVLGEGHVELLLSGRAERAGDADDAALLMQLAQARLDAVDLARVRPSLVRLGHRWLARAAGARA